MKILHIREMANVARNLADAQTALGHSARVMARTAPVLEPPDVILPAATDPLRAQLAILRHHPDLRAADVLHIHGGIQISELIWPFLRRLFRRKVIVVQLHGSEARSGKGLHHLEVADEVFCSTPDLLRFVPGSGWLPNPVKIPSNPSGIPAGKPVLGHFPTNRQIKGTGLILDAFRGLGATSEATPQPGMTRLENDSAIMLIVEDQPHSQAMEIMDRCTFVIDQVNDLGIYSMVSVEGMARGKIVLSSYDPALYPVSPPIVRVSSETLADVLEAWFRERGPWEARGQEGRRFVGRVHGADRVAAQALRSYYRAAAQSRPRGDELKRYWKARGPGYFRELIPGTERMRHAAIQEEAVLEVLRRLEFRTYVEVGCGFGRILKRVADTFSSTVVGIDLSLDQLRTARAYVPAASPWFVAAVSEHLPLRDRSADLVFASEVLMHLDPEQVSATVREMARVTRRYIVSVDWYEDFMVGEQVQYNFVHDYRSLYSREGFSVRRILVDGSPLQSIFLAELS